MTLQELAELRDKVEKEYRRNIEAIEIVATMLGDREPVANEKKPRKKYAKAGSNHKRVTEEIRHLPDTFNTGELEAHLITREVFISRSQLRLILFRMVNEGVLEVLVQGDRGKSTVYRKTKSRTGDTNAKGLEGRNSAVLLSKP